MPYYVYLLEWLRNSGQQESVGKVVSEPRSGHLFHGFLDNGAPLSGFHAPAAPMTLALWVHGIKPNRSKPIVKELSRHKRPDLPPCSVGRLADSQPSRFLSYAVVLMTTSGYAAKMFSNSTGVR
jgi:hypothetical protein